MLLQRLAAHWTQTVMYETLSDRHVLKQQKIIVSFEV